MLRTNLFASLRRVRAPCVHAGAHLHVTGRRPLHLHEGVSKHLLGDRGCRVQKGLLVDSPDAVRAACSQLPGPQYVIKAQILAGGRGKGVFANGFHGGVHVVSSVEEAIEVTRRMLNQRLITKQTTSEGLLVTKVLVAECVGITGEAYLSILLDRSSGGPVIVASKHGGVDIETVAEENPEHIIKMPVDVSTGLTQAQANRLVEQLELTSDMATDLLRLYRFMVEHDVLMLEVNPLARDASGKHIIIDAKIQFDDSARFRQESLWKHEDVHQSDPLEVEAAAWDLNYVKLQGCVGCLVNGAGLAMATMDIISLYGASPANFLDVSGSASEARVRTAIRIIQRDPDAKLILVNIFGGIMKCDVIARGIISAYENMESIVGPGGDVPLRRLPLVVRFSGTNADEGRILLRESGLPIRMAQDLEEAARLAVELAKESESS